MAKHTFRVDLHADDFALTVDGKGRHLDSPHVQMDAFHGSSGSFGYEAREVALEAVQMRLDRVQWTAAAASVGGLTLRSGDGNVTLAMNRLELPRGLQISRAERGVELVAPHLSVADAAFIIEDVARLRRRAPAAEASAPSSALPDSSDAAAEPPADAADAPPSRPLRQRHLHFLDKLTGQLDIDLFVDIDLPVISSRKATHALRIPIRDGSFDFKQVTEQLQGIEGRLLEFERVGDRLVLGWGLPLMSTRELVSWQLDDEAMTMAVFDRLPLRCLIDWRRRPSAGDRSRKKGLVGLKALALRRIALAVAMTAPARLDIGEALIQLGDEASPGLFDVKVGGDIIHSGGGPASPTALAGTVGILDATIKDLRFGGATLTADRIHLDGIEDLTLAFTGVQPGRLTGVVSRVAGTNVRLVLA